MLYTYLQWAGFETVVAGDSITATSVVMREKPDLVLLDMGLPGGEGMLVLERIKSNPVLAGTPVIIISGRDQVKYYERSLRAGAAAYFKKPFNNAKLVEAIKKALEPPA
jgi:DNA-binding response OmpR family regulator